MPRFTEVTFVTASVPSSSFLDHNEILGDSTFDILKLKIVPSIVGGTSAVQIYERDTFLVADLVYGTNNFAATGFDPVQKDSAGIETEALRGFVAPYEDQDVSGELHIKLVNNDSQAKTYTVTVVYETVPSTSVVDIDDLGDVVITAPASGELLKFDGTNWINNTLTEAGVAAATHVHSAADITTGTLVIARGGTGQITAQAAMDALSPVTTLGDTIYRDASNNVRLAGNITTTKQFLSQTGDGAASAAPAWASLLSSDLPTHVHSAADVTTGTLAIARGGTNGATAVAGFDNLSPVTTLGDTIYRDASNNVRLAGNITSANQFLMQTGTGSVSAAPSWGAIIAGDLPTHNHDAADINTGVLAVARGGIATGATPTNGQLLIGNGTDYTLAVLIGDANEIEITNGGGSINIGLLPDVRITTSLAIGGAPATSAGIELGGTTRAVLVSRLTTTQRDALTPVDGMIVYNSTVGEMQGRVGAAWIDLGQVGSFVDASGTPLNDQLAVWTDADTIEGTSGLTYDGSTLTTTGDFVASGVGPHAIGGSIIADQGLSILGTLGAGVAHGTVFNQSVTPGTGESSYVVRVQGTITEFSSGVHTLLAGLRIDIPTITVGAATVTDAASFYLEGPTAATVTGENYTLWIDAGLSRFDGSIIVGDTALTNASAGIELDSTTLSLLFSRMTTGERDALTAVDGMVVYNSSTNQLEGRVNAAWIDLGAGGTGFVDIGGIPANNQLGIWVDSNTMEGDTNLTWNTTLLDITGALTVSGAVTFTTDLTVPNGGTGASTFTDGGILLGSGTGAITALGVATNGQIPIGDGAGDPVLASILGTSNEITIINGAGSIQVGLPNNVTIGGALIVTTDLTVIDQLIVSGTGSHAVGGTIGTDQLFRIYPSAHAPSAWTANRFHGFFMASGTLTIGGSPTLLNPFALDQITYDASSAQTITHAPTLHILGAPIAGSNVTITNLTALLVETGESRFGAVGTNDSHVHIVSPANNTIGLVVEVPINSTTAAQQWHYDGTPLVALSLSSGVTQFRLAPRNLGNNIAGPSVHILRNTNGSTEGPAAASMLLEEADGTDSYIWTDATGDLRIHTAAPTGSSGSPTVSDIAGIEVGAQTSWYKLKDNIKEFVDYQSSLDKVLETPLYSFDMKGRHFDTGYVIHSTDIGKWFSWNDDLDKQQVPVLNDRNLYGHFAASIKALNNNVESRDNEILSLQNRIQQLEEKLSNAAKNN